MSEPAEDALELALMDPELRRNRARAGALLAEDFVEFGASGRQYTRASVLEMMATEEGFTRPAVEDFACRALTPGLMLVTYRTMRTDGTADCDLAQLDLVRARAVLAGAVPSGDASTLCVSRS